MSLHCKLVPVQYREYEYGLLIFAYSAMSVEKYPSIFSRQIEANDVQRSAGSGKNKAIPEADEKSREEINSRFYQATGPPHLKLEDE